MLQLREILLELKEKEESKGTEEEKARVCQIFTRCVNVVSERCSE